MVKLTELNHFFWKTFGNIINSIYLTVIVIQIIYFFCEFLLLVSFKKLVYFTYIIKFADTIVHSMSLSFYC